MKLLSLYANDNDLSYLLLFVLEICQQQGLKLKDGKKCFSFKIKLRNFLVVASLLFLP